MTSNNDPVSYPTDHLKSSRAQESLHRYLQRSWQRRHFALSMATNSFRSRNQNTVLGNLWNLLNPLLTAGVYFLIFGVVLNASRGIDNYAFWLVIGLFAFRLTQTSVTQGAVSVTSRQGMVRSIRFPRILLPVASTIGALIGFAFEVGILIVFAFATGEGLTWRILFLPGAIALHTSFNFGCALIAARCNDSFGDVQKLLPFAFQLSRYLCGVMVPLELFEDRGPKIIHSVLSCNPLVWILDFYRWIFMGRAEGMQTLNIVLMVSAIGILALTGLKFFAAAEHRYGRP